MLKSETGGSGGGGGGNNFPRVCDNCRSAASTVYCRDDSAYLCAGCDTRIHAAKPDAFRHERVMVCEGCEKAPAAFICKADAASLCAACDADIHSANPLARRHHRVPVLPISGFVYGPQSMGPAVQEIDEEDENEAASWLLLNPAKNYNNNQSNGVLFGGEVDEYLDLVEYNSSAENQSANQYDHHHHQQYCSVPEVMNYRGDSDSVVPVQFGAKNQLLQKEEQGFQLGYEYESSKSGYDFNGSINHSVTISSMDVGVVPESSMSEISVSHTVPPKGTVDLFSGPPVPIPSQLTPMDREARVLRYREKKKMRKFEKTIRYASRKAYAEMRPRIKGRFVKRTDVEAEMDQMFSTALMAETGYGIVPSF